MNIFVTRNIRKTFKTAKPFPPLSPPLPNILVISNGRIEIKSTIFIEDRKNDNFLGDEINRNMYSNVNQLLQIEFIIMHVFHICTPSGNSGFTAGILSTQKTTIDSNMISTDTTAKILPGNEEFGCSNNIHMGLMLTQIHYHRKSLTRLIANHLGTIQKITPLG